MGRAGTVAETGSVLVCSLVSGTSPMAEFICSVSFCFLNFDLFIYLFLSCYLVLFDLKGFLNFGLVCFFNLLLEIPPQGNP